MAEQEGLPEEIDVEHLMASTKMKAPEEVEAEQHARTGELGELSEERINLLATRGVQGRDSAGQYLHQIRPDDYNSGGHFTKQGHKSLSGGASTATGERIPGRQTEWFSKPKEVIQPVPSRPTKPPTGVNGNTLPVTRTAGAPQTFEADAIQLRTICGNLIMDWLLSESNQSKMNLPNAVYLTDKQKQGKILQIPMGDSILYRIHPADWVEAIRPLLSVLSKHLQPSEADLLFRSHVEVHPDFAGTVALMGL